MVNAMKADPSLPIYNVYDLESVLPDAERVNSMKRQGRMLCNIASQGNLAFFSNGKKEIS